MQSSHSLCLSIPGSSYFCAMGLKQPVLLDNPKTTTAYYSDVAQWDSCAAHVADEGYLERLTLLYNKLGLEPTSLRQQREEVQRFNRSSFLCLCTSEWSPPVQSRPTLPQLWAQVSTLRLLLALATLFHFALAAIDVKSPYHQDVRLNREFSTKNPKGWAKYVDEIRKQLAPAYGLVKSGWHWQFCVKTLLTKQGFVDLPGVIQFRFLWKGSKLLLIFAKVVDDIFFAGKPKTLHQFQKSISEKFELGRISSASDIGFIRLLFDNPQTSPSLTRWMNFSAQIPMLISPLRWISNMKNLERHRKSANIKHLLTNWVCWDIAYPESFSCCYIDTEICLENQSFKHSPTLCCSKSYSFFKNSNLLYVLVPSRVEQKTVRYRGKDTELVHPCPSEWGNSAVELSEVISTSRA